MADINLATKYSSFIDELMKVGALTTPAYNVNIEFVGVKTVNIYSMATAPLNDYTPSGANRYGTPEEIKDTLQELTLTQAKSFTFTIDTTNRVDTPEGVRDAGRALGRQISDVIIPHIDTYRLGKLATDAGAGRTTSIALSKTNAYETFIGLNAEITDAEAPLSGRIAFCTPAFVNLMKKDANFVKQSDIAQRDIAIKGLVGQVDGVNIILTPTNRMPAGSAFIITHGSAAAAPVKLSEYRIHTNPPGIAGSLVEGLLYHDAFLLNNKADCVRVCINTTP